jgi:tRNA pseudouridine13 synthase
MRDGMTDPVLVTSDNIGDYTIEDLVLPLPGCKIEYPPNMKAEYERLLAADGLTSESFEANVKSMALTGAFRKAIAIPKNLEAQTLTFASIDDIEPSESGSVNAIEVAFSLPPSSYATMFLRELMKHSPS